MTVTSALLLYYDTPNPWGRGAIEMSYDHLLLNLIYLVI
jgi:hypothetical protein